MIRFIETFRQNRKLKTLELKHNAKCDDLKCYRRALKTAIERGSDGLSTALRQEIGAVQAECLRIRSQITIINEWLKEAKANNTTITTG
jgi:hypothetical protein